MGYVYLAGPVRGVSREEATAWRETVSSRLLLRNFVSFDPARAWSGKASDLDEEAIAVVNDTAVSYASVVAVRVSSFPSAGTRAEVELAADLDKPIVLFLDDSPSPASPAVIYDYESILSRKNATWEVVRSRAALVERIAGLLAGAA